MGRGSAGAGGGQDGAGGSLCILYSGKQVKSQDWKKQRDGVSLQRSLSPILLSSPPHEEHQ